jgi:hypothetical protein
MDRMLSRSAALVVGAAAFLAGCSATPSVTSSAPGKVFTVYKTEPVCSGIDIFGFDLFSITRPVRTRFWVFAEDGMAFLFDPPNGPAPSEREPRMHWVAQEPALTVIAEVNGLPVALHLGHLLVGVSPAHCWRDYGPVTDGETVEFTADGIVVDGQNRGAIPGSQPAVVADGP